MTQLEQRLRRGMNEYSERIRPDAIRPLRELSRARRSRTVRWLAPAAAAVAVTGIVVGVSLAGPHAQRPTAGSANDPASAVRGMPQYFVTVSHVLSIHARRVTKVRTEVVVHDSVTGRELAAAYVPTLQGKAIAKESQVGVTAAADDRRFVVYEVASTRPGLAWFFLLRVAADGRSVAMRRLSIQVPSHVVVGDVALSPDGTRLAMQESYCPAAKSCDYDGIRLVTIATGAARTWTARPPGAMGWGPSRMSWAGNSLVAFEWLGPKGASYRLLKVTGPGSNLLASRVLASPAKPDVFPPAELITADGRVAISSTVRVIPDGRRTDTVISKIIEFDARTGRLLRVLRTVTARRVPAIQSYGPLPSSQLHVTCIPLSLAPRGIHLLIMCAGAGKLGYFGHIDGTTFSRLPGPGIPAAW